MIQSPPPRASPAQPQHAAAPTTKKAGSSLHARFFSKRSKTDLGSDNLAAYRKSRSRQPQPQQQQQSVFGGTTSTKYPAPKVPTFTRPIPQKRSEVVAAVERRISLASAKRQQQQQQQQQQQPVAADVTPPVVLDDLSSPVLSILPAVATAAAATAPIERPKPEIKEKPQFTTFKSAAVSATTTTATAAATELKAQSTSSRKSSPKVEQDLRRQNGSGEEEEEEEGGEGGKRRRMSKTVSEGDLMHRLRVEGLFQLPTAADDENRVVEHVSTVEPVSITVNSDTSSQDGEGDKKREKETKSVQHSREEGGSINRLVIDTSKDFDGGIKSVIPNADVAVTKEDDEEDEVVEAEDEERDKQADLDSLVLPPPPQPFSSSGKSEPLLITTRPLVSSVGSSEIAAMSESADRSCSTSFESTDESLPRPRAEEEEEEEVVEDTDASRLATAMATSTTTTEDLSEAVARSSLPETGGGEGGAGGERRRHKSPSTSTMSRSPPSPSTTGLRPLRKVAT